MDGNRRKGAADPGPKEAGNDIRATPEGVALMERMSGGVLLSHSLSTAVPSALKGLTSGFGMGPVSYTHLTLPTIYSV